MVKDTLAKQNRTHEKASPLKNKKSEETSPPILNPPLTRYNKSESSFLHRSALHENPKTQEAYNLPARPYNPCIPDPFLHQRPARHDAGLNQQACLRHGENECGKDRHAKGLCRVKNQRRPKGHRP